MLNKGTALLALLLAGCGMALQPSDGTGTAPTASKAAVARPTAHPDAAAYASTFGVVIRETASADDVDPDITPTPLGPSSVRFFPQQAPVDGPRAAPAALAVGVLTVENGCL